MIDINELRSAVEAAGLNAISREEVLELLDRLEEAESECLEQARLNGMGSEREAALMAKLETAEKAITEAYRRGYATGQEEIGKERVELLEALTALVRDSERVKEVMLREAGIGMIDEVGLDKARAAIARATGESEAKPWPDPQPP